MSRRRFFRRGVWPVRLRPLLARIGVFLVLVMAVTLTVRCTRDLNPARGEGGVVLSWKAEPGGPTGLPLTYTWPPGAPKIVTRLRPSESVATFAVDSSTRRCRRAPS